MDHLPEFEGNINLVHFTVDQSRRAKLFSAEPWFGLFAPPCGQMSLLQQCCVKFSGSLKVNPSSAPVFRSQGSYTFNPQCRNIRTRSEKGILHTNENNTKLVFLYINVT